MKLEMKELPDISRLHAEPRSNLGSMSDRQLHKIFLGSLFLAFIVFILLSVLSGQIFYPLFCFIVFTFAFAIVGIKSADDIIGDGTTEILDDWFMYRLSKTKILGLSILADNPFLEEDRTYGVIRSK